MTQDNNCIEEESGIVWVAQSFDGEELFRSTDVNEVKDRMENLKLEYIMSFETDPNKTYIF